MNIESEKLLHKIIEMGEVGIDPSSEYQSALAFFDNAVREALILSKRYSGFPSPTARHFYASVLFTQMLNKSISLLMISPHTSWSSKIIEHWDYASMAGVARTLLELRIAFYYICSEECSEDEWHVRWNILNLHDCTSRMKLFAATDDQEQIARLEKQATELRDRLISNKFFAGLDPKNRKKFLHGQTAYLSSLEDIAERSGISIVDFRQLYTFFSSHVHALPMLFYRIGGDFADRGRGLPSRIEDAYSTLCLNFSTMLVTRTHNEMCKMFEEIEIQIKEKNQDKNPSLSYTDILIGEERMIKLSHDISLRLRRIDNDNFTIKYIHSLSENIVLERTDKINGDVELRSFDPYFWNIFINNGPATEEMLIKFINSPYDFRIDHNSRSIFFRSSD